MATIRARAPVRIDFAGGWTDVALFAQQRPGAVVNAAISIYSYATISNHTQPSSTNSENQIPRQLEKISSNANLTIYSADFDIFVEAEDIKKLEYNGQVDLVKAALRRMEIERGFDIVTRSNAPAGSGLGTSATMGVALFAALAQMSGRQMLSYEVAELASDIEKTELGIRGGKQDHYASALGGFNFMEFFGENVRFAQLPLSDDTILELQKNLVLCYTGTSRLSGDIHSHVTKAFERGDKATCLAIDRLKDIARETKQALMSGDLDRFAELLSENWENQKRLHPSVTNGQIDRLFEVAMRSGALGGKACGAGGGGCVVFYAAANREHLLRKALEEAGVRVIDFEFASHGLQTWQA